MSEPSAGVTDQRRSPFCYQTHTALDRLRDRYQGRARVTALAIYLTLTEAANRNGGAAAREGFQASRRGLYEAAGVADETFDRYVKQFEEIGLLRIERHTVGSVNLPNTWVLIDPALDPPGSRRRPTLGREDDHIARDQSPEPKKTPQEEVHTGTALEPVASEGDASPVHADRPANRPAKVGGKTVSDGEYATAATILGDFNAIAKTRYTGKPFIEMIIRRMREHPDVTIEQHAIVIGETLARPWWDGAPSPNVIYGNAAIFEKSVHSAVMPSTQGLLTGEEIRNLGQH